MTYPAQITITVTEDDIKKGHRKVYWACPIARAFVRVFPDGTVEVFHATTRVYPDCSEIVIRYELPREAGAFIEAFDLGETVIPFTFTAERISPDLL